MPISSQGIAPIDESTPVLIVGGSLVGLASAAFLARFGIPSLLVERHSGAPFPRAGGFNIRTMELFRMAGIEEAIAREEPPAAQSNGILRAESLAGKEFGWVTDLFSDEGEGSTSLPLPIRRSHISQSQLEGILKAYASSHGANLNFNTEFLSWKADAEGITTRIQERATGIERTIRSRYLIAADGNLSSIRQQLGIATEGPGILNHQVRIAFSADLRPALRGRHIIVCYVDNPTIRGPLSLTSTDTHVGALLTEYHPEQGEQAEDFSGERGIALIRAAIGIPDLDVEIFAVRPWILAAQVAERFQQERIFLAGDSAHVMPPSGGLGVNTGIADAYNLAWKLAMVIQGIADQSLLSTYEAERKPVAQFTVEQAFARYASMWAKQQPDILQPFTQFITPIIDYITVALGYRYHSIATRSSSRKEDERYEDPRHPTGRPGTHAAYLTLERQGKQFFLLDILDQGFVLLVAQDGEAWCEAARQIAVQLRSVLSTYSIGPAGDYIDVEGHWYETYGITTSGAVLLRPDGFIAWRTETMSSSPRRLLEQTLLHLLGLST